MLLGPVVFLLCGCAIQSSTNARQGDATRTITVDVTVEAGGVPVSRVPVILFGTNRPVPVEATDSNGLVHLTGMVGTQDSTVAVMMTPFASRGSVEGGTIEGVRAELERFDTAVGAHCFRRMYRVSLLPDQASYSLRIVGGDSIQVTGRIVDSDSPAGTPGRHVQVIASSGWLPRRCGDLVGDFVLEGLPRGEAFQLFLHIDGDTRVIVVDVPAHQDAGPISLGDVTLPARPPGRPVRLTMQGRDAVQGTVARPSARHTAVTLIGSSGDVVHCLSIDEEAGTAYLARSTSADRPPRLPPGTYYVCPGALNGQEVGDHLLAVLRTSDGAVRLDAAQAIKLEIPATGGEEPFALTFDAKTAEDRIMAVPY